MTEQNWNEFLEKLDFAQLTSRWSLLPLHWLDEARPRSLDGPAQDLYDGLLALPKELEPRQRDEQVHQLVKAYRQARASRVVSLDPSLTPPGSRVTLRYLDPEELGEGDCLVTVGSWDRLGHYIAQQAGLADEPAEPSENPVRKDPGSLAFRHLLIFPDKGTPAPRAFRALCEKTLRQARGLGARRIVITHLHLPQPGLPDRFAAAEVVSAVRQMLREGGGGLSVELAPLTAANFEDYDHWFQSLAALARGERGEEPSSGGHPGPSAVGYGSSEETSGEPVLASALRDLAQKTSSLAQEASRGVTSWLRSATAPSPAAEPHAPVRLPAPTLEPTFEDRQALNLLYLGRWKEAETYRDRWERDTLMGLYLAALYKVVSYLDQNPVVQPEPPAPPPASPEPEAQSTEPVAEPATGKGKKKGRGKKKVELEETVAQTSSETASEKVSQELPAAAADEDAAASEPASGLPQQDPEYLRLRQQLLETAHELGEENPLTRYFLLLAWRLDERLPQIDPDQLEEDHARILRAAWAYEDTALLTFLRQARQDREEEALKPPGSDRPEPRSRAGYVPVFPTGSRAVPRIS